MEDSELVVAAHRRAWLSQVNGSAIHKIVIVLLPRVWYVHTIGAEGMDWAFDEKKYYTIPCSVLRGGWRIHDSYTYFFLFVSIIHLLMSHNVLCDIV